jgi:hypothetical protein
LFRPLFFVKRFLAVIAIVAVLIFLGDAVSVRLRAGHPRPGDPFEAFTTSRLLAIQEKNGKTEYQLDQQQPEQTITCVHSIFPHYGYSPCWYVKKRLQQPIPMILFLNVFRGVDNRVRHPRRKRHPEASLERHSC